MDTHLDYCDYFQARMERSKTLFVTACLRSFEHLAFDRSVDPAAGISEFFVPHDQVAHFIQVMQSLQDRGYVQEFWSESNRLKKP